MRASPALELNTFSIVAHCPRTGMLGAAVSTAVPAVGALCPFVSTGLGAVCTQSWVNPYLALEVLRRLQAGESAPAALDAALAADEGRDLRQIGVVDATGKAAAWSGIECTGWYGHIVEPHVSIQGNMLTGSDTLDAMARAFHDAASAGLPERLLLALKAGDEAGGDRRGRQSAALKVHHREAYAWVDLRVDEHPHPVAELGRIYEIARIQVLPFVAGMPRRGEPAGGLAPEVSAMLLLPPTERPGGGSAA